MRIFVVSVILFGSIISFSNNVTDSLKNLINNANENQKSKLYLELLKKSTNESLAELIDYAEMASYYARQSMTDSVYSQFLNQIGLEFYFKSNYSLAERYFQLSINEEIKLKNQLNIAKMYSNIAVTYEQRTNYQKALEYYQKALDIFEKANYDKGIGKIYNNIGVLYQEMEMKNQCVIYLTKSLSIKLKTKDLEAAASTLNNLGVVYEELIKKPDTALIYYYRALKIYDSLNNELNYAITMQNISAIYLSTKKFEQALKQFLTIEIIFKKYDNKQGLAWTYRNIAQTYLMLQDLNKVEKYLNFSIYLAKEINDKQTLLEDTKLYADFFFESKDFRKCSEYLYQYIELNDSVKSSENQKNIDELNKKHETSLLEYQISLLDKENILKNEKIKKHRILIYTLIVVITLLIVLFLIIRMLVKTKNEQLKSELEQKVLRLQMNPHFISNALVSAQSFILENKSIEAADYLADLSGLMRKTLKATSVELISLAEELEFLTFYLKIQQQRMNNGFDFRLKVDNNLNIDDLNVPPMLFQPFAENSIKHGFKNITYQGLIEVEIEQKNGFICIIIRDNGIGYMPENNSSKNDSYSVEITKQRLNKFTKNKSVLSITNRLDANEKGTEVKIMYKI